MGMLRPQGTGITVKDVSQVIGYIVQKQTGSRFAHAAYPQCYGREAAQLNETQLTAR